MKKILIGLFAILSIMAVLNAAAVTANDYVGKKNCKLCHAKKYKSWKKTAMATSFNNLRQGVMVDAKMALGVEDKDYTDDPDCLKCHTTGYGKGGFTSIDATPDLAGITCEACHGPGSAYRKIMKKGRDALVKAGLVVPDENNCLTCHSGDSPFVEGKPFNFKKAVQRPTITQLKNKQGTGNSVFSICS